MPSFCGCHCPVPLLRNTPRPCLLVRALFGFLPDSVLPNSFPLGSQTNALGPLCPFAFTLTNLKYKLRRWSDDSQRTPQANSDPEETGARMMFGGETRGRFRGTGRGLPRAESVDSSCHVLSRLPRGMEGPEQPRGQPDATHKPPAFSGFSSDHLEQSCIRRGQGHCKRELHRNSPQQRKRRV